MIVKKGDYHIMTFNSILFICLFLPFSLLIYNLLHPKVKNAFLVLISVVFYAATSFKFILLLFGVILFNFCAALFIGGFKKQKFKTAVLAVCLVLNLLPLLYYKYGTLLNIGNITAPLGISFFTFKSISYLMDVYRQKSAPSKNIINVALYITIFPQIISGPIDTYSDMAWQFSQRKITSAVFADGIRRFVFGLAKKVIIADVLGVTVDRIFQAGSISEINAPIAWLGALCYTLQIFFDFSGYTDMAIGIGKMFGFEFAENFNFPYISKSITEFWKRWHISLSSWFKNYLYIPLGGNRRGNVYFNLLVVFLTTGLWHGAGLKFVLWGIWHGIFMIIERVCSKKEWYKKIPAFVKWTATMLIVIFGWVIFRAGGTKEALGFLSVMFGKQTGAEITFTLKSYLTSELIFTFILVAVLSFPVFKKVSFKFENQKWYRLVRLAAIQALLILGMMYSINSSYSPFIYFQF